MGRDFQSYLGYYLILTTPLFIMVNTIFQSYLGYYLISHKLLYNVFYHLFFQSYLGYYLIITEVYQFKTLVIFQSYLGYYLIILQWMGTFRILNTFNPI